MKDDFLGLTIALSKGRILDETLPLFDKANIRPLEDMNKSRKLIFGTSNPNVRFLLLRASDVPTYVEHGAADIGISGKDTLMEYNANVYELMDLNIARCRLMTAGIKGKTLPNNRRLRIATKYANVAREYFASKGEQVDIIKLYGSMELAPLVGLGDLIVDVVDTGNTLRANGLEPFDEICQVSSRLIANPVSYKRKLAQIQPILDILEETIRGH